MNTSTSEQSPIILNENNSYILPNYKNIGNNENIINIKTKRTESLEKKKKIM